MNNYSIDIETLGTSGRAYILSIGIAQFEIETGEIGETYHAHVRANPNDFDIDIDTIMWWMKQSDEARKYIFEGDRWKLCEELQELAYALKGKGAKVWGNGATFDISIMENAYNVSGIEIPWKHWDVRDMRTIVDIASMHGFKKDSVEFTGTPHNALDDAIHQARIITAAYGVLAP